MKDAGGMNELPEETDVQTTKEDGDDKNGGGLELTYQSISLDSAHKTTVED